MGRGRLAGIRRLFSLASACGLLAGTAPANAAVNDVYVPDDLAPWVDWVLEGREYLDCPFFFNRPQTDPGGFVCAWPGELDLRVTAGGAQFTQPWTVYAADQWVPLPGDTSSAWPEQVTANGQPVEVLVRGSTPSVRLAPGRYTIAGDFAWDEPPRVLAVPAQTGLLSLAVSGEPVVRPERTGNSVWLAGREPQTRAEDSLDVQVYRLVADDVPTRLITVFRIDVGGRVREVALEPALPDGFTPLSLESALPARLESDGKLRLQVRPGSWEIRLLARAGDVLDDVGLPAPVAHLPEVEIWSYRSNEPLRVTVPEALAPVDPRQVSVPGEWQELPAFRVDAGQGLRIVEQSRGVVAADNRLTLERTIWLDFEGRGFTFVDAIGGVMRSDWRLDMAAPYSLLSASEAGENLLVTLGRDAGMTGVEVRRRDVDLEAVGRSESRGTLPVSGWSARFDSVDATLNLPPGNKLLAAIGADSAPGSWVERWKLLDFFLVLIATLATARLFGRQAGAIALLALALSWHEPDAPQWIWVNLLAAVALARVAPEGRLKKSAISYRGLSFAVLVLALLPFFAGQLRIGIYPQLEPQRAIYDYGQATSPVPAALDAMPADAPAELRERAAKMTAQAPMLEEVMVSGSEARRDYARYAPNAIVQAGPGIPEWRWNTYSLGWSGPVDAERTLRLVVLPRWFVTALRFLGVLLLLAFAARFACEILNRPWRWPGIPRAKAATATVATIATMASLSAAGLLSSQPAEAQLPTPELLQQLEQRLLEPPPCAPQCAEIVEANVTAADNDLAIVLTVHAEEDVAVPLPGSLNGWRPQSVQIDGATAEVYRSADQSLWVRSGEGRHRVTLRGPIPPVDSLEVPFPLPPRVVTVASDGWSVAGIRDRRLQSGSLQLARSQVEGDDDATARWESTRFPPFARIERTIRLDLDWRVSTEVVRVAPEQGALSLDVPLLEGESILSGDFQVEDGLVRVSMNPGVRVVRWESTLPRTSPLSLHARAGAPWKDVWRFGIGSIWRAGFKGVPESEGVSGDARVVEFYPRGGESLTLEAERPEAAGGATLAFDNVSLRTEVGARSSSTEMSLAYRSTRGAQHAIRLPESAAVVSVVIDGRNEPLRAVNGELSVPILPGEHEIDVRWQQDISADFRVATPPVDLAAPAGNIELGIELPANRWVLATGGPRLGPAVMYWSELAAMLLVAFVLGRIRLTPLTTRHWLLLGLGFSTFSWPALVLVAGWLLAAGARGRWTAELSWWRFDAVQVVLGVITIAALAAILATVPAGLLGTPDMHVVGNGSWGSSLRWFADRSESFLPGASVISLPMWVYKALILAWALWLSLALLRWLPWVWSSLVSQGLWRSRTA